MQGELGQRVGLPAIEADQRKLLGRADLLAAKHPFLRRSEHGYLDKDFFSCRCNELNTTNLSTAVRHARWCSLSDHSLRKLADVRWHDPTAGLATLTPAETVNTGARHVAPCFYEAVPRRRPEGSKRREDAFDEVSGYLRGIADHRWERAFQCPVGHPDFEWSASRSRYQSQRCCFFWDGRAESLERHLLWDHIEEARALLKAQIDSIEKYDAIENDIRWKMPSPGELREICLGSRKKKRLFTPSQIDLLKFIISEDYARENWNRR